MTEGQPNSSSCCALISIHPVGCATASRWLQQERNIQDSREHTLESGSTVLIHFVKLLIHCPLMLSACMADSNCWTMLQCRTVTGDSCTGQKNGSQMPDRAHVYLWRTLRHSRMWRIPIASSAANVVHPSMLRLAGVHQTKDGPHQSKGCSWWGNRVPCRSQQPCCRQPQ